MKWNFKHVLVAYLLIGTVYALYYYTKHPAALTVKTAVTAVAAWPLELLQGGPLI